MWEQLLQDFCESHMGAFFTQHTDAIFHGPAISL